MNNVVVALSKQTPQSIINHLSFVGVLGIHGCCLHKDSLPINNVAKERELPLAKFTLLSV